jgi:hypothetical protein
MRRYGAGKGNGSQTDKFSMLFQIPISVFFYGGEADPRTLGSTHLH